MYQQRLEYIDALRGFTMILVVFAHVETFMFSIEAQETFLSSLFQSFRMPLFFFISGFLSYKVGQYWDYTLWKNLIYKRLRSQIIPTIILGGGIYTICFLKGNILDFFCDYHKLGYWFTICLFGIFFIFYTVNLFLCKTSITKKGYIIFIFLIMSGVFYFLRYRYENTSAYTNLLDVFCIHQIYLYFPFFILGYISSLCKTHFYAFLDNDIMQAIIFVGFGIFFYLKITLSPLLYEKSSFLLLCRKLQSIIIPMFGIFIVFNIFYKNQKYFVKNNFFDRTIKYIGRHTLEIYLLHYFFLLPVPTVGSFIITYPNLILELFVGLVVSLLIIGVCLVVSNIVKTNQILGRYLLGIR